MGCVLVLDFFLFLSLPGAWQGCGVGRDDADGGELMEDNGDKDDVNDSEGDGAAVASNVPGGATTTVTIPACAAAVSNMSRDPVNASWSKSFVSGKIFLESVAAFWRKPRWFKASWDSGRRSCASDSISWASGGNKPWESESRSLGGEERRSRGDVASELCESSSCVI